jgi:hypothetical protein
MIRTQRSHHTRVSVFSHQHTRIPRQIPLTPPPPCPLPPGCGGQSALRLGGDPPPGCRGPHLRAAASHPRPSRAPPGKPPRSTLLPQCLRSLSPPRRTINPPGGIRPSIPVALQQLLRCCALPFPHAWAQSQDVHSPSIPRPKVARQISSGGSCSSQWTSDAGQCDCALSLSALAFYLLNLAPPQAPRPPQ